MPKILVENHGRFLLLRRANALTPQAKTACPAAKITRRFTDRISLIKGCLDCALYPLVKTRGLKVDYDKLPPAHPYFILARQIDFNIPDKFKDLYLDNQS